MTFYGGHYGKTLDLKFPDKETCDKITVILEQQIKDLGIK